MADNAPAFEALGSFIETLDEHNIKYKLYDDRPVVSLPYDGNHFSDLDFIFIFDDDGGSVAVKVYTIKEFEKRQLPNAYKFCNNMNFKFRWVRFYIDNDMELTADMDAVIGGDTIGEECFELLARCVSIVDDVCEVLESYPL